MATVMDVLAQKGGLVVTIDPRSTVLEAAMTMNEHRIGALVCVDEKGVCGMFTERDILTRVVVAELEPSATRVREAMTWPVIHCSPKTTLDELRQLMRTKRIRHVPVIDMHDELCGMISIGDLNVAQVQVMTETIGYLEQFMYRG